MDKKLILSTVYKNRFLILSCIVLIFGNIFGISMLKFLPQTVSENLFLFASNNAQTFTGNFLNRFCFPFAILLLIFIAGFSLIGKFTAFALLFINGAVFGFESGISYAFYGTDYILNSAVTYFTATIYFVFLLIIMTESSVFSSNRLLLCIKDAAAENPHYNAKNQVVKFITFTVVFALFSAFSAYFTPILQELF